MSAKEKDDGLLLQLETEASDILARMRRMEMQIPTSVYGKKELNRAVHTMVSVVASLSVSVLNEKEKLKA